MVVRQGRSTVPPLLFLTSRILETEAYRSDRFEVGFGLATRNCLGWPHLECASENLFSVGSVRHQAVAVEIGQRIGHHEESRLAAHASSLRTHRQNHRARAPRASAPFAMRQLTVVR